jgi:hypothetical protein
MWWLAFYFAIMGFQAVDPEVPAPVDPALFIILSFLMAAACGLVAVVCGYLAYRFIKKARMPE